MEFDHEQMKRRRQEKQEERQRKARAMRKLWIRLGIAAAVLLVVAAAILVIVLRVSPDKPEQPQEQPQQNLEQSQDPSQQTGESTQPSEPTEIPEGQTVIHLVATGDLNVNDTTVAAGGPAYIYTEAFLDVAHLLADADVSVVNFEGGLYGDPFGTEAASAPQSMVTALAEAGVDIVQLANSYSIYSGVSGLRSTIAGVRQAGMEPLGAYETNAAFQESKGYYIKEVGGVKIAFVAFTKGMDGMALPAGSEKCVNVLYTDYSSTYQKLDTDGITSVMKAAASQRPDLTVVLLHWGSEFNDQISDTQEDLVELFQKLGADAIIGTHPHYVQQMSLNEETGFFVAYSLGDFFGDAARAGSEYSVILDLEITKDNRSGKTAITGYSYTPIFTVTEKGKTAKVVRIHEAMRARDELFLDRISDETYAAMEYALTRIEARIHPEEE